MNKPSLIGRTLHHFEIQDELGRGGMAVVYRAHQTNLQRSVAIKVLPPEMTFDQSYIARFQQEARAAAGLEHSHIVPIYEVGEAEGFHYIVMKYIEGETLKEVIDRHAPMSVERVYELLEPIARALDYAHSRGVVHRDIKPSNVMINQDGWVFLTDFGLARGNTEGAAGLTQAGTIMGTPEYMSPEQAQGLTVGAPSDIYSLAIMAYQMLSKHTPFKGDNPQSILFARVMHAPTPISDYLPGVPVAVEDVLMRALARDPAKRFDSAKVFLTALREAGKQVSTSGQATIAVPAPHIQRTPSQPSYPPQGQQPSYPPPGYGQPGSQPSYPPQGQQPSYPPPGYRQPGSQPGYPPQGQQPSYPPPGYRQPGSQPSYPPQGQQPSYPPSGYGQPGSQPSYPPPGYVRPAQAPAGAQPYQTPAHQPTLASAPGPGYAPYAAAPTGGRKSSRQTRLWMTLGAAAVLGVLALVYFFGARDSGVDLESAQQAFEQRGQLDQAQTLFVQAVEDAPGDFDAQLWLGLSSWMQGKQQDLKTAEQAARAAIQAEPERAEGHALLSLILGEHGNYTQALAQAEEAVRLDEKNALGYAARAVSRADFAWLHDDRELMDQALADSEQAINLAADDERIIQALAHNSKGYALWIKYQLLTEFGEDQPGLVAQGIDEFNRAIGLQGQLPLLHSNLGYFYSQQAMSSGDIGLFDKATKAFDAAIAIDDSYSPAWAGKGWMVYDQQQDAEPAIPLFDIALEHDPHNAEALIGRGFAQQELGYQGRGNPEQDFQSAERDYLAAIRAAPYRVDAYVHLGYLYLYALNQPTNAEDQFRQALEQDKQYVDALVGVGDALQTQNYFAEAIDEYNKALDIDPAFANAYVRKAEALRASGDTSEARNVLSDALSNVRESDQYTIQAALDSLE